MIALPLVEQFEKKNMSKSAFELKPHEEILLTVHQTLMPNAWRFALYVLWLVIPFFFLFPLFREGLGGVLVFFGLVISGGVMLYRRSVRWSQTVLVLTDKRIIDIDQRGFFDRVVTEVAYTQIDEASYRVKGFWATIFRYGTIRLDLNGSAADILFDFVPRPAKVHNLINDLRAEYRHPAVV